MVLDDDVRSLARTEEPAPEAAPEPQEAPETAAPQEAAEEVREGPEAQDAGTA